MRREKKQLNKNIGLYKQRQLQQKQQQILKHQNLFSLLAEIGMFFLFLIRILQPYFGWWFT